MQAKTDRSIETGLRYFTELPSVLDAVDGTAYIQISTYITLTKNT
jgi:hypothetical protein